MPVTCAQIQHSYNSHTETCPRTYRQRRSNAKYALEACPHLHTGMSVKLIHADKKGNIYAFSIFSFILRCPPLHKDCPPNNIPSSVIILQGCLLLWFTRHFLSLSHVSLFQSTLSSLSSWTCSLLHLPFYSLPLILLAWSVPVAVYLFVSSFAFLLFVVVLSAHLCQRHFLAYTPVFPLSKPASYKIRE